MQLQKEQYHQYALNKNNELIFINDARKEDGPYICPNCKEPLIVKNNGKIRQHHFAHKSGSECCWESYLHKCAKCLLKQRFDKNEKFEISYSVTNHCPKYDVCELAKFNYWKECNGEFVYKRDLKQIYDTCEIERGYNGFIGDVKLSNSQDSNKEPMFLEVLVEHKCSDKKINSGLKMIEIEVNSFEDVFKPICDQNINITFYNFDRDLHKIWGHRLNHYKFIPQDIKLINLYTRKTQIVRCPHTTKCSNVYCNEVEKNYFQSDELFITDEPSNKDMIEIILNNNYYFTPKCSICIYHNKRNYCYYGGEPCWNFIYRRTEINNNIPYVFIKRTTNDTKVN